MRNWKSYLFAAAATLAMVYFSQAQVVSYADVSMANEAGDKKIKGTYEAYMTQDGTVYEMGDVIYLTVSSGKSDTFRHVAMGSSVGDATLTRSQEGTKVIIKDIKVVGNKKFGFEAYIRSKSLALGTIRYYIRVEGAHRTGEITFEQY